MELSLIRTAVRQRANMENTQFVTDIELNSYINASYGELYDILLSRFEDYFMKLDPTSGQPPTFTLAGGVNFWALPSDLYKLRGLDVQVSPPNDWNTVYRYNFSERNSRSRTVNRIQYGLRVNYYRVLNQQIQILPEDQADGTYRIWYIPRITKLVSDADDTSPTILDWEEYIVVDASIKCMVKEESDATFLIEAKQGLIQRIKSLSSNRDAGQRERIGDVRMNGTRGLEYLFPR